MSRSSYLYVEDDRLSREIMEMIMSDLLHIGDFTVFEDSSNFMTRLHNLEPTPDIIFLDIHMSPVNGFEMLKLIRKDPALGHQRVFALTASVMNEEVLLLREAGFDGVIGKPLDADTFPDLIKRLEAGDHVWQIT